jgi:fluoroquinolone resistance protein
MMDGMNKIYIEDKIYDRIDFSTKRLEKGDYDSCRFQQCNFSHGDLSNCSFSECSFRDCNMGMVHMANTSFNDVRFIGSKLPGIYFEQCNELLFSVYFEHCMLDLSSFYKRNLKKVIFSHCSLQEVDFTESDLTLALFDHCNLAKAKFDHTLLEKADLRTSFNFSIDPSLNKIKKAKFSLAGLPGLLDRYELDIS